MKVNSPTRRAYLILLLMVAVLAGVMALPPIAQDPTYHDFADNRAFFGIPSFLNVITNFAFLAGNCGESGYARNGHGAMGARWSWTACFIGTALVGPGPVTTIWRRTTARWYGIGCR